MSIDNQEELTDEELDAIAAEVLSAPACIVYRVLRQKGADPEHPCSTAELAVLTGLSEEDLHQAQDELKEKGFAKGNYGCDFCGYCGPDEDDVAEHRLDQHPDRLMCTCNLCGVRMPVLASVDHTREFHPKMFSLLEPLLN